MPQSGFSVFEPRVARAARAVILVTAMVTGGLIAACEGYPLAGCAVAVAGSLYVLATAAFTPLTRSLENRDSPHHMALIAVDLLIITAIVWLTGGVRSEYYLLYYVPIVYAAVRLRLRDGVAASLLAAVLYAFVGLGHGTTGTVVTTTAVRTLSVSVSAVIMVVFFAVLSRESQAHAGLREHLHNSLRRVSAVYDVAHAANTGAGLSAVLSILLEQAARSVGAERGGIALLDARGRLEPAASRGGGHDDTWAELDPASGSALQALADRAAVALPQEQASGAAAGGGASRIFVPLLTPGGPMGVLGLACRSTRRFRRSQIEFLEALCSEAATAVENLQLRTQLQKLATTDHLTGLYSRREAERRLAAEVERASRYERPLTVLLLDIDNLKEVNDHYGHAAGDQVLCTLARLLGSGLRSSDVAGRVGGDEFLVVLPEVDAKGGEALSQRLIDRFREELDTAGNWKEMSSPLGLSAGVASSRYGGLSAEQLFSRADEALYRAKRTGKGRTCVAPQHPEWAPSTAPAAIW